MDIALVALAGLIWGSFANVVIARVPRDMPWIAGSSMCPRCNAKIAWFDNIPVASWLVLRGRCRQCRESISIRYLVVEIGTAAAFVAVYVTWGLTLTALAFAYLAAVSIILVAIDLDVHRLPDSIVLPSFVVGGVLLTASALAEGDLWDVGRAALGAVALGASYGLLRMAYRAGMGGGDVTTAGLLGMYGGFLGWSTWAVAAFWGPIIGGLIAAAGLLTRRLTRKSRIPFGPALIAGAWLGYFFGAAMFDWYIEMLVG
ncbi:MAG: prepilin peptidase [Actinobacteria bacterium HGW-Actinobacteria-4]|nr:MAG: prepilin peptidase [Actinobacteria bacterium HGW-Actinobacteria-4]